MNPVLAKLPSLSVTKNYLRRIRDLMMSQRKKRLRDTKSLSVLRRIKASWNVITIATKVTLFVSVLSQSRLSPH